MAVNRLQIDTLLVDTFEVGGADPRPSNVLIATEPTIDTEPDTWEDTCIKMCPTDDTCTSLGCTR
ncbi:MAG TPA: hypothetical protein VFJ82_09460 [Longimicrobium sp.]|nr:hypothetical protein [Longimicrobium sp.]